MSVTIVCPHCNADLPPAELTQSGRVRCTGCDGWFDPTPGQATVIEALSRPAGNETQPEDPYRPEGEDQPTPAEQQPSRVGAGAAPEPTCSLNQDVQSDEGAEEVENPWVAFGRGSRLASIGVMIELAAATAFLLFQFLFLALERQPLVPATPPQTATLRARPPVAVAVCAIGVVGAGMLALGRSHQARHPTERLRRGPAVGVAWVGWISFGCSVAALALLGWLVVVSFSRPISPRHESADLYCFGFGVFALFAAGYTRWCADLGTALLLALASGMLPNRALRDRVAGTIVLLQLGGLCGLGLFAGGVYAADSWSRRPERPSDGAVISAVGNATAYLVVLVYLAANLGLHIAGRRAADEWEPDVDE